MWRTIAVIIAIIILVAQIAQGQEAVLVPDVTGTVAPVAVAELNRLGLAVGREVGEPWTADTGLEQNTIAVQSIAPGTTVEAGTALDLTVLRSPNTALLYDDNDLKLVNQTGGAIDLTGMVFQALDGNSATFASRWGGVLREDRCAKFWSVNRNGPKGLDDCRFIKHWRTTTQSTEHFWTGTGGTTQFSVIQNGIERGVCAIANPGRCEFYLPSVGGGAGDTTGYV